MRILSWLFIILAVTISGKRLCSGLTNCYRYKIRKICTLPTKILYKIDSSFYMKYVQVEDVLLMSSDHTSDWSLIEAARTLDVVLSHLRSDLVIAFRQQGWKILIYGGDENFCSLPETRSPTCIPSTSKAITTGNMIVLPALRQECRGSGFSTYSTLVHELAHAFNAAFNLVDINLQRQLENAYMNAKVNGIWPLDQYVMIDINEYFASLWEPFWFTVDHFCGPDPRICSKDATVSQDPRFNAIMEQLLIRPQESVKDLSCTRQCDGWNIDRN